MMKFNKFFLALAAVATMVFASCDKKYNGNMQFRTLGSTGIMVSEIGIGCGVFENLDSAGSRAYMDVALDSGINYMDLYDATPEVLSRVGYALEGRRAKMHIQGHIGNWFNPELKQQERTRNLEQSRIGFEDQLARLGTDFIEVGLIFMSDNMEDWDSISRPESPFMQYCQSLVAEGKVKHLGVSSHNAEVALAAAKSGLVEVIMFSLNPAFDRVSSQYSPWEQAGYDNMLAGIDPVRTELYNYCASHDIAITVMKAFGGRGRLLDAEQSPLGYALTTTQCLAYALANPAVKVAFCGTRNLEQLVENLHYVNATDEERDYLAAIQAAEAKSHQASGCTYCGHCTPCPVGIDIAEVNALVDQAEREGGVSPALQQKYDALEHHASECIGCGACEKRCPFQVPVREKMRQAVEKFGK